MHRRYAESRNVDADDYAASTGTCNGSTGGDCRRLDADADGVVSGVDQAVIAAYVATLDADTELQRVPAATHSRRGNLFAHQGLVLDAEIGSYQNRARQYAPGNMRYSVPDPLTRFFRDSRGFIDGANLYGSYRNNPLRYWDTFGLNVWSCKRRKRETCAVVDHCYIKTGLFPTGYGIESAGVRGSQELPGDTGIECTDITGMTNEASVNACIIAHLNDTYDLTDNNCCQWVGHILQCASPSGEDPRDDCWVDCVSSITCDQCGPDNVDNCEENCISRGDQQCRRHCGQYTP